MAIKVLENKPIVGEFESNYRLDLTYPSVSMQYDYYDDLAVVVKRDEVMRADILSINFFGNPEFYDVVLKANGISNPFSIDEGEIFFAPELNQLISNLAPSGRQFQASQTIRQQYINPNKKSLTDTRLALIEAQRIEAMKKRAESAAVKGNLLPPNIANEGDREIVVKGGKIYFGKDVVKGKEECAEPLSKSEFLARLIKNRVK